MLTHNQTPPAVIPTLLSLFVGDFCLWSCCFLDHVVWWVTKVQNGKKKKERKKKKKNFSVGEVCESVYVA